MPFSPCLQLQKRPGALWGKAQPHTRAVLAVSTLPSLRSLADSSSSLAGVLTPAALQVPCSPVGSVEPPLPEVPFADAQAPSLLPVMQPLKQAVGQKPLA